MARILAGDRPERIVDVALPRRESYYPSPVDWRDEVFYFLLPDRFSDGREESRPLLDRTGLLAARPSLPDGTPWQWNAWAESGLARWQGGALRGIISKLDYLCGLGVTALWLAPVFKQRVHLDTYHGYGVQDFLDVDPHLGTRADLSALVEAAHARGMRVVLGVVVNHTGANWLYPPETPGGTDTPRYTPGRYPFGAWRGAQGKPIDVIVGREDGVWPRELQCPDCYTRAGTGNLDGGDIGDPQAEHKRSDFGNLRNLELANRELLDALARCYQYWIALTDCDGFRVDALKHLPIDQGREFCQRVREFAANIGKSNFFLVGEVAGGDRAQARYLQELGSNLDAALDIADARLALNRVARGTAEPREYFRLLGDSDPAHSAPRPLAQYRISILDDHDHVYGEKVRFCGQQPCERQVIVGLALQLLTTSIPCIYYGTEQGFAGPEPAVRQWLPEWGLSDRYLREAMFGPEHPRKPGAAGLLSGPEGEDPALPGFGPFGTAGRHCFDPTHPIYRCLAALVGLRAAFPCLRHGRQYLRQLSADGQVFAESAPGQLIAWSRILDDEEALCVANPHGTEARSAYIPVDPRLCAPGSKLTVVLNSDKVMDGRAPSGGLAVGSTVSVQQAADDAPVVQVRELPPAGVVVLTNRP